MMALYMYDMNMEVGTAQAAPGARPSLSPSSRAGAPSSFTPRNQQEELLIEAYKRRLWIKGDEKKGRAGSDARAIEWWTNPDA